MTAVCAVPPIVGSTYTIGEWSASDVLPGVTDADGNTWHVQDASGLMDSPAPRTNVVAREQSDGDFDGDTFQPGRVVTLDGVVKSPDFASLYSAMRVIRGLLVAGPRRLDLVAALPDLTVQTLVRRDGATVAKKLQSRAPVATWSLILYAPDPTLYGTELKGDSTGPYIAGGGRSYNRAYNRSYGAGGSDGIAQVINQGNVDTYPLITISAGSGALVNPTVTVIGGNALVFAMTLNPGDTLTIDTRARTVLLNGDGPRTWPLDEGSLGAPGDGVTTSYLFTAASASSDASMTLAYRDAYQ